MTLAIVHVYYPERWPELAACLRHVDDLKDLIVTYGDEAAVVAARQDFPRAQFLKCANVGYDVWPFVAALKTVDLSDYDRVLKLHTKRDLPTEQSARPFNAFCVDGPRWRNQLLSIVRSPAAWQTARARLADPNVGMVANRWVIARENGVSFVAGTMFVARPQVLKAFQSEPYSVERFAPADDAHMGSFAHDCEREFGRQVTACGLLIAGVGESPAGFWIKRLVKTIWSRIYRAKRDASGRLIVKILKVPVYRQCNVKRKIG